MGRPRLTLAPGKEKSLQRHHPWIFSGAIRRTEGNPQEGDLVDVVSPQGEWLCVGHYQNETIRVKVLSYDTPDINEDFWRQRLLAAITYRRRLGLLPSPRALHPSPRALTPHTTTVFRLIHAEGDNMPGLVADYYNGIVVLQAHSVGMHRLFPLFVQLLRELLGEQLKAVFDKSSATVPGGSQDGYLWGIEPAEWEVNEYGNRLMINFYEGQKTGFFVDQRENRHLVQKMAQGQRVLNCFGYTGGFSLGALRGGASYVETVDISRKAIELCNRNVEHNFGSDAPHKGVVADVLKYLDQACADFDIIILDPPAFAKSHRNLQQGLKGYRTINQKAMEKIGRGGMLFTFSCSQAVSNEDFQTMVFSAANLAHRQVRIVSRLPHAADHPISIYHPEGEYLKGLLLYIE